MSDLWYRSCRGVEHGGHSLVLAETRFFWRIRHHIRCAEKGCGLDILEPGFRQRRTKLSVTLQGWKKVFRVQLKYGLLREVLILFGGLAIAVAIYCLVCAIVRVLSRQRLTVADQF